MGLCGITGVWVFFVICIFPFWGSGFWVRCHGIFFFAFCGERAALSCFARLVWVGVKSFPALRHACLTIPPPARLSPTRRCPPLSKHHHHHFPTLRFATKKPYLRLLSDTQLLHVLRHHYCRCTVAGVLFYPYLQQDASFCRSGWALRSAAIGLHAMALAGGEG